MPIFTYKALNSKGAVSNGDIDAADRSEALRLLDRKGLQPVSIKEASATNAVTKKQVAKPAAKPIPRGSAAAADAAKIETVYRNGILTIIIPKVKS